MPVFHTKIIESILEPVAQQVSVKLIIYRKIVLVSRVGVRFEDYCLRCSFSTTLSVYYVIAVIIGGGIRRKLLYLVAGPSASSELL